MKSETVKNSSAYKRALSKAKRYLSDERSLVKLTERALSKASRYQKGSLSELWNSLMALIRLVKNYASGGYRQVSWQTLLVMVTALVYFVIPTDLIPDILLGWGLVDDAALLGWVIKSYQQEINNFLQWEVDGKRVMMRQDEPTKKHCDINGVGINVYEWAGEGEPLVLFHATGFHGRCWDHVIRQLPENTHVFAVDAPGHGLSDSPAMPFTWDVLSDDLVQVIETLDLSDVHIVGHSFGGYAATMVAAKLPQRFKQVLLLDPVIMDPELVAFIESMSEMEHPVARRRNEWSSVEEMAEAFAKRPPYSAWDRTVLEDYCRYGLQASDGQAEFELACPPMVEAEIYVQSGCGSAYSEAANVQAPVSILRARDRLPDDSPFDFSPSPTWEKLHTLFNEATDLQLQSLSHFFPMEQPAKLAQLIQHWRDCGSVSWPE